MAINKVTIFYCFRCVSDADAINKTTNFAGVVTAPYRKIVSAAKIIYR